MENYWVGLVFGMISGFGFGRAFQYWISEYKSHTPRSSAERGPILKGKD